MCMHACVRACMCSTKNLKPQNVENKLFYSNMSLSHFSLCPFFFLMMCYIIPKAKKHPCSFNKPVVKCCHERDYDTL